MNDTLVAAEWLEEHLDDPDLVVLDCTVEIVMDEGGLRGQSGRTWYDAGHIQSAGFADLTTDLCDPNAGINFALPAPEQFCAAMGALGVGDDSRVILYDNHLSIWAARVWWMLRWVGFDNAALLDGGLKAWTSGGRELSTEAVARPAKTLSLSLRPEMIADQSEVRAAVGDGAVQLFDTLPPEHFRGEQALYARPGHIPGATNVCAIDLLDGSGRYLPEADLAALHEGDRDQRVITYCGGGIMASSNAFVLARLGFTNVGLYAASLQEWVKDAENPMVEGDV